MENQTFIDTIQNFGGNTIKRVLQTQKTKQRK